VSLPLESYTHLPTQSGECNQFVHVGTIDFRRRPALKAFLQLAWPCVLEADAKAKLTLAGKIYGKPIAAPNTTYTGSVSSDIELYGKGRFAINFQTSTGGLKLKTLTSLAAGRVLISTSQGVEGVSIVSGYHYWDMNTLLSMPNLKAILSDREAASAIAEAGREYVITNHSRAAIAGQMQTLLGQSSPAMYAFAH
jgi:hypothetical protein